MDTLQAGRCLAAYMHMVCSAAGGESLHVCAAQPPEGLIMSLATVTGHSVLAAPAGAASALCSQARPQGLLAARCVGQSTLAASGKSTVGR